MPTPAYCLWCGYTLAAKSLDGIERLACTASECSYVHWDNPTPVVAAIVEHIDEDGVGKIILAHNVTWPASWYALITGFLEKDESPEAGVVREVKEELDLDAEIVSYVGHYPFPQANQLILAWHVRASGVITLNEELDDYKSLLPEDVVPWPFGTGDAVRDWLASQGY